MDGSMKDYSGRRRRHDKTERPSGIARTYQITNSIELHIQLTTQIRQHKNEWYSHSYLFKGQVVDGAVILSSRTPDNASRRLGYECRMIPLRFLVRFQGQGPCFESKALVRSRQVVSPRSPGLIHPKTIVLCLVTVFGPRPLGPCGGDTIQGTQEKTVVPIYTRAP